MTRSLIIEPDAEADLLSAFEWYEERRAGLGLDFMLCIEATLGSIVERPKSFPRIRRSARRALVRRFPYLVLFVDRKDAVVVVGFFHTAQSRLPWARRLR